MKQESLTCSIIPATVVICSTVAALIAPFDDIKIGLLLATLANLALFSTWYDLRQHRIPNSLTYSVALASIYIQLAFAESFSNSFFAAGLEASLFGFLVCFGLTLAAWLSGGMGAGDVKLAAGIGLLLGIEVGLTAILSAHLVAAAYVIAKKIFGLGTVRRQTLASVAGDLTTNEAREEERSRVPMAGFYLVGIVISFLFSGVVL